jgi:threonine aldolase
MSFIAHPNPHFGSDNHAGVCPEIWEAYRQLGGGHHHSYGDDETTTRARKVIRDLFDTDCEVFFVFNGTAANALALASICQSFHGVICAKTAHVATDECGAPAFFSNGLTLLEANATAGKITPDEVQRLRDERLDDVHFAKPRAVSVAQATELGTVYTRSELEALREVCGTELAMHMDGARFANAVAELGVHPSELTSKAGVDVLCFGGTKMGMPPTEAIVFFNGALAKDFDYRRKQAGQLASKMRLLAIPWLAMLENDTWLKYARNANQRAAELEASIRGIEGVTTAFTRQANGVFLELPDDIVKSLSERWLFYQFFGGYSRFMCSWDTTNEDVKALAADIARCAGR